MGYRLGSKVIRGVARSLKRLRARRSRQSPGVSLQEIGGCPFFKDEVLTISIH